MTRVYTDQTAQKPSDQGLHCLILKNLDVAENKFLFQKWILWPVKIISLISGQANVVCYASNENHFVGHMLILALSQLNYLLRENWKSIQTFLSG